MLFKFRNFIYSSKTKISIVIVVSYILLNIINSVAISKGVFAGWLTVLFVTLCILIEPVIDNFVFNLFSKAHISFKSFYYEFLVYNATIYIIPTILGIPSVFNFYTAYVNSVWITIVRVASIITKYTFYTDVFTNRYKGNKKVMVVICILYCMYYLSKLYNVFFKMQILN